MSKSNLTVGSLVKYTELARLAGRPQRTGSGCLSRLEESGLSEAQSALVSSPFWVSISIEAIGLVLKDVGERRLPHEYQFLILFDEKKVFVDREDIEEHV